MNIRAEERKVFQINAYRVLLTRACQGVVICVPEGNPNHDTRLPAIYDGTYQYLKQIGIEGIENSAPKNRCEYGKLSESRGMRERMYKKLKT